MDLQEMEKAIRNADAAGDKAAVLQMQPVYEKALAASKSTTSSPQDGPIKKAIINSMDTLEGGVKSLTRSLWQDTGIGDIAAQGVRAAQVIGSGGNKNVEDFGNKVDFGDWLGESKTLQSPLDAIGNGLKIGSMFTPVGEAGGAANSVLKASGLWGKVGKFIKETAPFALPYALGEGTDTLGKGGDLPEAAKDTAFSYLENLGGFGLLKGGQGLLKYATEGLVQNQATKYLSTKLAELADYTHTMMNAAPSAEEINLAKDSFNLLHNKVVQQTSEALKAPDVSDDLWSNLSRGVGNVVRKAYDTVAEKYQNVYLPTVIIPTESAAKENIFKSIATNASKFTEGAPVTDSLGKGYVNLPGKVGGLVNDIAAQFKKGDFSLKSVDDLWRTWGIGSPDKVENQAMKNILMDVNNAAKSFLEGSGDASHADILKQWDSASQMYKNISQNLNGNFTDLLKTAANPGEFVDHIFNTKPTSMTENISQLWNNPSLPPELKQSFSQTVYNAVLDRTLKFSTDMAENGKQLEKFVKSWAPQGIMSPDHILKLKSFSDLLQGSFDDFAKNVSDVAGVPHRSVEELTARTQQIAEAEALKNTSEGIEKITKGRDLVKQTPEGTNDFSLLKKVLNKVNDSGQYDEIIDQIDRYDQLTDSNKHGIVMKGIGKVIAGTLSAAFGHKWLGLSIAGGAIRDFAKKGVTLTEEEAAQTIDKILASKDTSAINKIFYSVIGERIPAIKKAMQIGGMEIGQYMDAAKRILMREPTKEEEAQIRAQFEDRRNKN